MMPTPTQFNQSIELCCNARRMKTAPAPATRLAAVRSDGQEARAQLLSAALALFAEHGFAKTSTRAIAQAAGVNLAAIRYYFGDKAGLYAACFDEPMGGNAGQLTELFSAPELPIAEALRRFLTSYVEPLKQGEIVRQCMRLHMREMLEPTGRWAQEVERDIKGPHMALLEVLARHLGVPADDDLHRLTFAITGLGMQLFITHDLIDAIHPRLMRDAGAIDRWSERLVDYALVLVDAEQARRRSPVAQKAAKASKARSKA
jgi:AcrR family transcriptional regulator